MFNDVLARLKELGASPKKALPAELVDASFVEDHRAPTTLLAEVTA